jgi:hypothetical protein
MSKPPDFYCCDYSRQAGEQLFATATEVKVWLLLEHNGVWGAKAFEESDLPEHIKVWLNEQLAAIPGSRMQLIRQDRGRSATTFYVALSREKDPVLYEFDLTSYDDLLALNIPAVVAGDSAYQTHINPEPVFAVCTNGKRDISCARYGALVYPRMAQHAGYAVWQTIHIGGHRFAATCICLPYGVIYGRIPPERAIEVVEETRRGRIVLDLYRGRSSYPPVAQAADYYLRLETGIRDLSGLQLVDVTGKGQDTSSVQFRAEARIYRVDILMEKSGVQTYQNSTDSAPTALPQYRLLTMA